jgi:hypothetical protein
VAGAAAGGAVVGGIDVIRAGFARRNGEAAVAKAFQQCQRYGCFAATRSGGGDDDSATHLFSMPDDAIYKPTFSGKSEAETNPRSPRATNAF